MTHLELIFSSKAELREGPESGVFIHQPQNIHRTPTDMARLTQSKLSHVNESQLRVWNPLFESKDSLRVKQHHSSAKSERVSGHHSASVY